MRILYLTLCLALLSACGSGEGYARPAATSAAQFGGTQSRPLEQRVGELERILYNLAIRLCRVENKLGSVTFTFPPNGGVTMQRSGQPPQRC
jgi:hypothetical protein